MSQKALRCLALCALAACFFLLPAQASAKELFAHQNTTVPAEQTVDDVVVLGGNATIEGTVQDAVIVINGNVQLKASAKVNGLVFVIGGQVEQEPGAVVTDEIVNLSLDSATRSSLLIGGGLAAGMWLLQLAATLLLIAVPVLAVLFSRGRTRMLANRVQQAPGPILSIGAVSSLLLLALMALLTVTLIGIPLALLLLLAAGIAFLIGFTALSLVLGEQVQWAAGRTDWQVALTGSIVLAALMNIPFVGLLLALGIFVYAIGVVTLWGSGKMKRRQNKRP